MSQTETKAFHLPFSRVEVFDQFKLVQDRIQDDEEDLVYTIRASSSQCDTVVVLTGVQAESTGLEGEFFNSVHFSN
jgi:hypothetical protein